MARWRPLCNRHFIVSGESPGEASGKRGRGSRARERSPRMRLLPKPRRSRSPEPFPHRANPAPRWARVVGGSCSALGQAGLAPLFRRLRVLDHAHEVLLVVDVALAVDVADVRLGRALRDIELLLDVGGVMAFGQEEQDLGLATRQEERVCNGLAFAAETAAAARRFAGFREARFGNRRGCGVGCLPFARGGQGG